MLLAGDLSFSKLIFFLVPVLRYLAILYIIHWFIRRFKFIKAVEKLPGPSLKSSHPWLSHIKAVFDTVGTIPGHPEYARTVDIVLQWFKESPDHGLVRVWAFHPYKLFFARANIFISDPDLCRQMLTDFSIHPKLIKDTRIYSISAPLLGDSVISLPDGPQWKHERKVSAMAFRQAFLEYTTKTVADLLQQKVFPQWGQRKAVEMQEWGSRMATEVLGLVAFSHSFGSLEEKDDGTSLYETFQILLKTISQPSRHAPLAEYLPTRENRIFAQQSQVLNNVILSVVEERASGKIKALHEDILSYFLRQENEMSPKAIFGNVRMFLFAGHDTTAAAIAGGLWELANHPKAQERLQKEVDGLFDRVGTNPSYKDLMQLPYLDAVVKETLRMHAAGAVARKNVENITITDENRHTYDIPAGCRIFYVPGITCRLDRYFDRPDEFDPDRFTQEDGNNSKNAALHPAFMPFSIGARNCVGQPLAMAELKAVLAHVMRHYSVSRNEKATEPVRILLLTMKLHEALIDVTRRQ